MADVTFELNQKYKEKLGPWIVQNLSDEQIHEFNQLMGDFVLAAVDIVSKDCVKDYKESYYSSHFGGMNTLQVLVDKIDIIYPEDSLARKDYLDRLDAKRNHPLLKEFQFLKMKEETSISGAMRWVFSQEAPTWGSMKIKFADHNFKA